MIKRIDFRHCTRRSQCTVEIFTVILLLRYRKICEGGAGVNDSCYSVVKMQLAFKTTILV